MHAYVSKHTCVRYILTHMNACMNMNACNIDLITPSVVFNGRNIYTARSFPAELWNEES